MTDFADQPLSPLDGRYRKQTAALTPYLSEAGLNRARVKVEIEWLLFVTDHGLFESGELSASQRKAVQDIAASFGDADIAELVGLEAKTNHDVKSVEILIRDRLGQLGLENLNELVHITCTSEDINNLSHALTIKAAITSVWLPKASELLERITKLADATRGLPMLAHTHGQPATPTTLGKELAVFAHRFTRQLRRIEQTEYLGKFNGATGTFAAHLAAAPGENWPALSEEFVTGLGLIWNPLTTQIESHDWQADLFADIAHANRILHNLATDIWTYISLGYFKQIPVAGEVGSSTMPHKVNPIRFENAEANFELSNALLESLASTLVTSRMQRDLTDSTSQRNIGVAIGHSLLALVNLGNGLNGIAADPAALAHDLDQNWEVLAEAIQTVIRAEATAGRSKITDPYSVLKEFTRGHRVDREALINFVKTLDISPEARKRLEDLTPETYTGAASALVERIGYFGK